MLAVSAVLNEDGDGEGDGIVGIKKKTMSWDGEEELSAAGLRTGTGA